MRLDSNTCEIIRGRTRTAMQPLPFHLLQLLIENKRMLTHEEIHQAIWPESKVSVRHRVKIAATKIRKAGFNLRCFRKRGYRLELVLLVLLFAPSAKSQHYIALTWTASVSNPDLYNVYRGTQSGGPYSLIGYVTAPTVTYSDTSYTPGVTEYYVVTAVLSGQESSYSNETSALDTNVAASPSGGLLAVPH